MIVSTREARLEPVSTAVFDRMTAATGGKAYFARNWRTNARPSPPFATIWLMEYALSSSRRRTRTAAGAQSPSRTKQNERKYHIRTRNGYRPQPAHVGPEPVAGDLSKVLP